MSTNVLMVSTSYPADLNDWRGLFIRHLADALAAREDLMLAFWAPPGEVHPAVHRVCSPADDHWFAKLVGAGGIAQLLRRRPLRALLTAVALLRRLRSMYRRELTDIYHINWLQNALPLPKNGRPALVTVLGADMRLLSLPGMPALMRRICRHRKVMICPNAEWMMPDLTRIFGRVAKVRHIAFGIDPTWFALQRRLVAQRSSQWLVVARVTRDKIGDLFEWGKAVFKDRQRTLHLFGPLVEEMQFPDWIVYHGPATPENLRAEWFPIAHGLITLSRHSEGRPQVMLEAMAAALPIIATRLAAHEDLLRHQQTGWLVDSAREFEAAILALESAETNTSIGTAARAQVRQEVGTWSDCAARYAVAYGELLADAT